MNFSEKEKILCFSKEELTQLFEISHKKRILEEMVKRGISFKDLRHNPSYMEIIADSISKKSSQDKDEHEIFASLFTFLKFYKKDSEVCFEVKENFDPYKNKIVKIEDLNKFRKIDSDNDFIIKSDNELRKFQLKRYRGGLTAEEIFKFIKVKLDHYCGDLGDTNLLILFQPQQYLEVDINFKKLHDNLKSLGLKSKGQILLTLNHKCEKELIIQIYPRLTKSETMFEFPIAQIKNWKF